MSIRQVTGKGFTYGNITEEKNNNGGKTLRVQSHSLSRDKKENHPGAPVFFQSKISRIVHQASCEAQACLCPRKIHPVRQSPLHGGDQTALPSFPETLCH